jgi:hypothetical protein
MFALDHLDEEFSFPSRTLESLVDPSDSESSQTTRMDSTLPITPALIDIAGIKTHRKEESEYRFRMSDAEAWEMTGLYTPQVLDAAGLTITPWVDVLEERQVVLFPEGLENRVYIMRHRIYSEVPPGIEDFVDQDVVVLKREISMAKGPGSLTYSVSEELWVDSTTDIPAYSSQKFRYRVRWLYPSRMEHRAHSIPGLDASLQAGEWLLRIREELIGYTGGCDVEVEVPLGPRMGSDELCDFYNSMVGCFESQRDRTKAAKLMGSVFSPLRRSSTSEVYLSMNKPVDIPMEAADYPDYEFVLKADGVRGLLVKAGPVWVLANPNRPSMVFRLFPCSEEGVQEKIDCMIDVEMIDNWTDDRMGSEQPTLVLLDVLKGIDGVATSPGRTLDWIHMWYAENINLLQLPINLELRTIYYSKESAMHEYSRIKASWESGQPLGWPADGLIAIRRGSMLSSKLKPVRTIDLITTPTGGLAAADGTELYRLWIPEANYRPVMPGLPVWMGEGRIVEVSLTTSVKNSIPSLVQNYPHILLDLRDRPDKEYPNSAAAVGAIVDCVLLPHDMDKEKRRVLTTACFEARKHLYSRVKPVYHHNSEFNIDIGTGRGQSLQYMGGKSGSRWLLCEIDRSKRPVIEAAVKRSGMKVVDVLEAEHLEDETRVVRTLSALSKSSLGSVVLLFGDLPIHMTRVRRYLQTNCRSATFAFSLTSVPCCCMHGAR